ncbi:MAG TPA: metal-dependent hydrolase [Candidatus Nanoarchaeia archaeon]|nr:metal-dependent hydrolase [Candidatus Nanoarchaeia archaeon]
MIFAHFLLGIILGQIYGNYFFFILGSIFPDVDHLYIILKNKIFSYKKLIDSIKNEKKYKIRYKTPLVHSVLGMIIFSLGVYFINKEGMIIFAIAYLLHLLMDWPDIDDKYYLYPSKIKFRGFLPIWSRFEKIATIFLITIIFILYTV